MNPNFPLATSASFFHVCHLNFMLLFLFQFCLKAKAEGRTRGKTSTTGWQTRLRAEYCGILRGPGEGGGGGCHFRRHSGVIMMHCVSASCFWLCPVHNACNDNSKPVSILFQIDRMEQFFAVDGLQHLMFYYQDTEPTESG